MVSAMNSSAVRAWMLNGPRIAAAKIVDVFGHDSLGLRLDCSGQDMLVIGVGKCEFQGRN